MTTVDEAMGAKSPLSASIAAGTRTLSSNQTIEFVKYIKLVLPLDGFVFWVRAELASQSALLNASRFNTVSLNQAAVTTTDSRNTFSAHGSLHYSQQQTQYEDDNMTLNRVVFTSEVEINDLNDVGSTTMYIGSFEGIRFAFSTRGSFYQQADTYHYRGDAIYPAMESQIIDSPLLVNPELVVSNSLPIWLSMSQYMPMYPAYLVPENLPPPYASVMIPAESTEAMQAAPYTDGRSSRYQLVRERVRVVVYGLRNNAALDFVNYVEQQSLIGDTFGVMNIPVPRDEKRQQNELSILAIKKSVEFRVNYNQSRIQDVARQYILSCIPTFYFPDVQQQYAVTETGQPGVTDTGQYITVS